MIAAGGTVIAGAPPVEFSGVSTDSRTVRPGALFVALRGERYDGHAFAAEALRRGAAAALVDRGRSQDAPGCLIPGARHAAGAGRNWPPRIARSSRCR